MITNYPTYTWYPPQQPYKCPVCEGRGVVPQGFYDVLPGFVGSTTSTAPETCKTCGGSGIIWR